MRQTDRTVGRVATNGVWEVAVFRGIPHLFCRIPIRILTTDGRSDYWRASMIVEPAMTP